MASNYERPSSLRESVKELQNQGKKAPCFSGGMNCPLPPLLIFALAYANITVCVRHSSIVSTPLHIKRAL